MHENSLNLGTKLLTVVLVWLCAASATSFAQETQNEQEIAAPPVVAMSKEEHTQLSAETDLKRRVQLCLQLADARLQRAEQSAAGENFQEALLELGGYRAVIESGLKFLKRNNNDSGRIRDNFRKLEMALRTHTPRLETIRRSTPYEYAYHMKSIMNFARDARTNALDSFFSDSVLRDNSAGGGSEAKSPVLTNSNSNKTPYITENKP
jgi:hypothetical protein